MCAIHTSSIRKVTVFDTGVNDELFFLNKMTHSGNHIFKKWYVIEEAIITTYVS